MAKLVKGLEKVVSTVGRGVNIAIKHVDRVLWGKGTISSAPLPGQPTSTTGTRSNIRARVGSFVEAGLFNALDALLRIDLCAILEYFVADASNIKTKRKESPNKIEQALYDLQDQAALVRQAIDSFYAFPDQILQITNEPNTQAKVAPGTNAEAFQDLVGSNQAKYNYGVVAEYISKTFKFLSNTQTAVQQTISDTNQFILQGLDDPEVLAALSILPGFKTSINSIKDYTNVVQQYVDYRTIPNAKYQELLKKLDDLRAICVTIESFQLSSAVELADKYLGTDVRSQIAQISKFIDPSKMVPTLKEIDNSLKSFVRACQTILNSLRVARGFVKIALVLVKIFRFIAKVVGNIPLPLMYATYSMVDKIRDAKDKAATTSTDLEDFLEQLNSLLSVIINVVRYVQANCQALIDRVGALIAKLELCDSMKDSPILDQLKQTQVALNSLNNELKTVIDDYTVKTQARTITAGKYTIRIDQEELTEEVIDRPRRRGIALDVNGILVAQSDLTFATNDAVIIEEVKFKLVALGLISPEELSPTDLIIAESMTYLKEDILSLDDLNVSTSNINASEAMGGLNFRSYLDQLPGASKLRRKLRKRLKRQQAAVNSQITQQANSISTFLGTPPNRP